MGMSLGADRLMREHNQSRLQVAEALILGKLGYSGEEFADELVSPALVAAARVRLESLGLLEKGKLPTNTLERKLLGIES